ncbi:uncharacterized protein B0P05DRAFT_586352 [Gilbertella persicaria]|uniref:uncharacterized protein n=1 Tax=Gilbertella persicaria TaxID=101096 RepID=UPI0022211AA5|nr:uncharacterized protein B0P05DRAFT_586352 [Gilbertella persicaria]KAI8081808.1 hypothetical protein B0P05DRAFT_586352 [Gilbertella persicaria]
MTEPSNTEPEHNKPSVVDDFFSALFANQNTKPSSPVKQPSSPPVRQPVSYDDMSPTMTQDDTLDEFDEYSLLSKRRTRPIHEAPAQILSKKEIDWSTVKPESRMLVRQFPKNANKHDILEYFSKYGEVIEVVQKDSFGFVHFEDPEACARAVELENGNILHGVTLDLEICKRKPYFARAKDNEDSPPSHRVHRPSHSPPPMNRRPMKRRTSITQRPMRPRPHPYETSPRRNHKKPLIPFRTGYAVPTVQIIAWGNNFHHFMTYVESVFQQYQMRTASAVLSYSTANRNEVVKQLVLEGVKAIVMIDRMNEPHNRIYLQVFAPNDQTHGGVRYDEYDSITPLEAIRIIQRTYPQSFNDTYQSPSYPSYQPTQPQYNTLDVNTLATLYTMIQPSPAAPAPVAPAPVAPAPVAPAPVQQQPTIPQLLATLMNGLNQQQNVSSTPPAPAPAPAPQPVTTTSTHEPSIAALISTIANSNPALLGSVAANNPAIAQLLYQFTQPTNSNGTSFTQTDTKNQPSCSKML